EQNSQTAIGQVGFIDLGRLFAHDSLLQGGGQVFARAQFDRAGQVTGHEESADKEDEDNDDDEDIFRTQSFAFVHGLTSWDRRLCAADARTASCERSWSASSGCASVACGGRG